MALNRKTVFTSVETTVHRSMNSEMLDVKGFEKRAFGSSTFHLSRLTFHVSRG